MTSASFSSQTFDEGTSNAQACVLGGYHSDHSEIPHTGACWVFLPREIPNEKGPRILCESQIVSPAATVHGHASLLPRSLVRSLTPRDRFAFPPHMCRLMCH